MKKYLISILSFFIFVSTSVVASAADKVTLQLQWFTQAQFAGYYVALDNGYYSDEIYEVEDQPILTMYDKDSNKATLVA